MDTAVFPFPERKDQQWEEEILCNMHHRDSGKCTIDSTSIYHPRESLTASALPSLQRPVSKGSMDLKLGNKSMVTRAEPPAICSTPLKDIESGDFVSMTSGNGDSNGRTASENTGRHAQVTGGKPSRRVTSRKRKFDEVCSFESRYPSQKKGVSGDKLAYMVKQSTSLVSLDEQLSTGSSCGNSSYTQAGGNIDSLPAQIKSRVLRNTAEGRQSKTDTQSHSRRFYNVLEPPIYPRPFNYSHILTRRQFQNYMKSTEGKVYVDVKDILSTSDDLLRAELKTRSMKAKLGDLKKVVQDIMIYPTVVLCRIDDKIQEIRLRTD
jgi:hypothetical protein